MDGIAQIAQRLDIVAQGAEVGSPITRDSEYDGHTYQDKDEVLTYDEPHMLSMTHHGR